MEARRGEKLGWIGGWLGGFLWTLILGGLWLYQGATLHGAGLLLLGVMSPLAILRNAPWRHPDTPYWRLMLPIYGLLLAGVGLMATRLGDLLPPAQRYSAVGWVVPCMIPLLTLGHRTWVMGEKNSGGRN